MSFNTPYLLSLLLLSLPIVLSGILTHQHHADGTINREVGGWNLLFIALAVAVGLTKW